MDISEAAFREALKTRSGRLSFAYIFNLCGVYSADNIADSNSISYLNGRRSVALDIKSMLVTLFHQKFITICIRSSHLNAGKYRRKNMEETNSVADQGNILGHWPVHQSYKNPAIDGEVNDKSSDFAIFGNDMALDNMPSDNPTDGAPGKTGEDDLSSPLLGTPEEDLTIGGADLDDEKESNDTEESSKEIEYSLKFPDGFEQDEESLGGITELFKGLKLPNQGAQKIVDKYFELEAVRAQKVEKQNQELEIEWRKSARADKEIGGSKDDFIKNCQDATRALKTLGGDALLKELHDCLRIASNPEIVGLGVRLARRMAESQMQVGGAAAQADGHAGEAGFG